jgi:hypothetical protein
MSTQKASIAMSEEEFIALARQNYKALSQLDYNNFYNFEKGFVDNWNTLGQKVMEASVSKTGKDKRKKTS